jgi:hypothetical protein
MLDMGTYFEPPPGSNAQLWVLLESLAKSGYRFDTEGSRAFFFGAGKGNAGSRAPSRRAIMLRIRTWLAKIER